MLPARRKNQIVKKPRKYSKINKNQLSSKFSHLPSNGLLLDKKCFYPSKTLNMIHKKILFLIAY